MRSNLGLAAVISGEVDCAAGKDARNRTQRVSVSVALLIAPVMVGFHGRHNHGPCCSVHAVGVESVRVGSNLNKLVTKVETLKRPSVVWKVAVTVAREGGCE